MALADTAKLAVELSLIGNFDQGIANAQRRLAGLEGAVSRSGSALTRYGAGLRQVGRGAGQVAGGLLRVAEVATVGLAVGLAASVKQAASFADQMNIIATIAGRSPLAGIESGIRGLAKQTGASLTDLTGAYYDLLSAGIKVADGQHDLELAYKLSRGALSTTGEAVDFLTTAINAYGLTQAQTTIVADQFSQAVADGKVKLSEISATFANVASVAKAAGVGLDEIATSYAYLTAQGVPAAEVTTEMNRAIVELLKPSGDLASLQDKLGKNYAELAKNKGLVPALEQMRIDAEKAGIPFQNLFGRIEAYKFALQTTGPAFAGFEAEQQKIIGSAGEMNKQFSERNQGLAYQLGRLKASAIDAAISVGQGLAPAVGRLAEKIANFVNTHGKAFVKFGTDIGTTLDNIPWDKVQSGLKTTADILGRVLDLLKKVPIEAQASAVGLLGLNKLSGGLIGQGIGNIAGGTVKILFQNFAQRGSSPGNPLWVASATGGIGGPGGIGGGGKGFGLLKFLGLAGIGLTITELILSQWDKSVPQTQGPNGTRAGRQPDGTWLGPRAGLVAPTLGPPTPAAGTPGSRSQSGFTSAAALAGLAFGMRAGAAFTASTKVAIKTDLATVIANIQKRSAERFGGTGLGKDAVAATFRRDMLKQAEKIERGTSSTSTKLTDLQAIQQLLSQHGDSVLAAQIGKEIDKLKTTVNVTVQTNVSVRDQKIRSSQIARYGYVAQ